MPETKGDFSADRAASNRPPRGVTFPSTRRQRLLFTAIGVLCMASTMTLFNKALQHGSLTWGAIGEVPQAFATRAPVAFLLQFFVVQKFAGKMTSRYQVCNRIEYYAIRTGFTVLVMCPAMSLYSNLVYVGLGRDLILVWITRMVLNWAFAFFVQIFAMGPVTRWVFGRLTGQR